MALNISQANTSYAYLLNISETVNTIYIFLCMPFILIGNLMVIISVFKFRKLQTTMNYFVSNLALADLLVGCPLIPMYIVFFFYRHVATLKYACLIKYACVLIGLPASALNLLLVTIDRFIAIIYPLHYAIWMTKYRAKVMITMIWVYSFATASMPLCGVNTWEEGIVCEFWTVLPKPFTIITVPVMQFLALFPTFLLYLKIFHKARGNKDTSIRHKNEAFMKRRMKNAKVMAVVFSMFLLFWSPLFTSSVFKYARVSQEVVEIVKQSALSLAMSNSLVNPIIYCWIRPDFRTAFKILLHMKTEAQSRVSLQRKDV